MKAYREANKDKIAERMKAYYEANKDKMAERMKAYYEAKKKAWENLSYEKQLELLYKRSKEILDEVIVEDK